MMTTPKAVAGGCHIKDEQTKQILYQPVILEITMTSTRKKGNDAICYCFNN